MNINYRLALVRLVAAGALACSMSASAQMKLVPIFVYQIDKLCPSSGFKYSATKLPLTGPLYKGVLIHEGQIATAARGAVLSDDGMARAFLKGLDLKIKPDATTCPCMTAPATPAASETVEGVFGPGDKVFDPLEETGCKAPK